MCFLTFIAMLHVCNIWSVYTYIEARAILHVLTELMLVSHHVLRCSIGFAQASRLWALGFIYVGTVLQWLKKRAPYTIHIGIRSLPKGELIGTNRPQ